MPRMKKVNLTVFLFLFLTYFLFDLFSFILFFRTRVRVRVTRSCCYTAGFTSNDTGHKSHDTEKNVEGSGRIM